MKTIKEYLFYHKDGKKLVFVEDLRKVAIEDVKFLQIHVDNQKLEWVKKLSALDIIAIIKYINYKHDLTGDDHKPKT